MLKVTADIPVAASWFKWHLLNKFPESVNDCNLISHWHCRIGGGSVSDLKLTLFKKSHYNFGSVEHQNLISHRYCRIGGASDSDLKLALFIAESKIILDQLSIIIWSLTDIVVSVEHQILIINCRYWMVNHL